MPTGCVRPFSCVCPLWVNPSVEFFEKAQTSIDVASRILTVSEENQADTSGSVCGLTHKRLLAIFWLLKSKIPIIRR